MIRLDSKRFRMIRMVRFMLVCWWLLMTANIVDGKTVTVDVTRSADGDVYKIKGFKLPCSSAKQDGCQCRNNRTFFIGPTEQPIDYLSYRNICIRYFGKEAEFRLKGQQSVPTLSYTNKKWHFLSSNVIAHKRKKKVNCRELQVVEAEKMGIFENVPLEEHPFHIERIENQRKPKNRIFKIVIDDKASKSIYEGELVILNLSCDGRSEIFLPIKFEGSKKVSGDLPPILIKPTKRTTRKSSKLPPASTTQSKENVTLIIGVTVGVIGVVLIVLAILIFLCIVRRSKPTIVVEQDRRSRSISAPPAYPGLDMIPPSYDTPKQVPFTHSQESLMTIPRRAATPLPPTPNRLPEYLMAGEKSDETYEEPIKNTDQMYEELYLKMLSAEEISKAVSDNEDEKEKDDENEEKMKPRELEHYEDLSGPVYRTVEKEKTNVNDLTETLNSSENTMMPSDGMLLEENIPLKTDGDSVIS